MYEVRVYDSSGDLKKVISEKTLSERSFMEICSPSPYNSARRKATAKVRTKKTGRKAKVQ